mgnify:CR=1 FL=1
MKEQYKKVYLLAYAELCTDASLLPKTSRNTASNIISHTPISLGTYNYLHDSDIFHDLGAE